MAGTHINALLTDFMTEHSGLNGIGYADLSTDMVLAHASEHTVPQEDWDALSAMAIKTLNSEDAGRIVSDVVGQPDAAPEFACLFKDGAIQVCVRRRTDPGYALCCRGDGNLDVAALVDRADALLRELAQDE